QDRRLRPHRAGRGHRVGARPRNRLKIRTGRTRFGYRHACADCPRDGIVDRPSESRRLKLAVSAIDMHRAEEFGGRMADTVNDALLTLSISVGHRTGLYDALANLDPATSEEIAERTGLPERYVREWLAAQLTGGIVEH